MTATLDLDRERARIRGDLDRYLMIRRAESALSGQAIGRRKIERESERDARRAQTAATSPGERDAMRDVIAARRRDALNWRMSAEELNAACQHATLAAKVRASAFEDVSQSLALQTLRAHRGLPNRREVSALWLRRRAEAIHARQIRKDDRAMGHSAAAEELADWRNRDRLRAVMEKSSKYGGDYIYARAENMTVGEWSAFVQTRELSAAAIAARLKLTPKQTLALAAAIDLHRVRELRLRERVAYNAALAMLRRRFPTIEAIRLAIRPDTYAVARLVEYAIRHARPSRQSHLGGNRDSASASERVPYRAQWEPGPHRDVSPVYVTADYARAHWPDRMTYGNPAYSPGHPAHERDRLARTD